MSRKNREISDVQLVEAIAQTGRNVRNAYWDLVYAINNLEVQRQSLTLAQQSLRDNRARVEIGTMAPIDIVEAQSEVARNDEAVIVAEAAIKAAEDRLRALIFDPSSPDFWSVTLEPSDTAPFQTQAINTDQAVQRALENRTDLKQAKNGLQQNDISIRYLRNQLMPEVNANLTYRGSGTGGTQYASHCVPPEAQNPTGDQMPKTLERWRGEAVSECHYQWNERWGKKWLGHGHLLRKYGRNAPSDRERPCPSTTPEHFSLTLTWSLTLTATATATATWP